MPRKKGEWDERKRYRKPPRDGVCPRCDSGETMTMDETLEGEHLIRICSCAACGLDFTEHHMMLIYAQEYMDNEGKTVRLDRHIW